MEKRKNSKSKLADGLTRKEIAFQISPLTQGVADGIKTEFFEQYGCILRTHTLYSSLLNSTTFILQSPTYPFKLSIQLSDKHYLR